MKIHRFSILFAAAAAIAFPGATRASSGPAVESASRMAGEILRSHPYLLTPDQRTEMDAINRGLRELESRGSGGGAAGEWIDRFLALLPAVTPVIPVTIEGESVSYGMSVPWQAPGDAGAALFRIEAGGEGTHCVTVRHDFALDTGIRFDIAPEGTTWALVGMTNIPAEVIRVPLELRRGDGSALRAIFPVRTPEPGRIKISVLSDRDGAFVPSMMRLTWGTTGEERPPANAIEFAPQFDRQGSPTGNRRAQLPGKLAGHYWCVPGPVDMVVPPGEWSVAVRRGLEHVAVFDAFKVKPGETVEKVYTPRRWVDMTRHGWYSGDDHVHCRILSDDDADNLMDWVRAEDIKVANVVKMGDIYRTWFEQRGWGEAFRVAMDGHVLSPGQECPRTHNELGHTIHMNTQTMVRDTERYYLYDTVFDEVRSQGGLSGYCHVLFDMFHVNRDMSVNIPKGKVNFLEIMQFAQLGTDLYYDFLNLGFKLTAAAGSDVPWGGTVGEVRMYAHLGDEPFSTTAWFNAVREGKTFVTNGPMIEFTVDNAVPGSEVAAHENRLVHVRARVWGDKDRFAPTKLEIVRNGETIRTLEPAEEEQEELHLSFAIPAEHGFWIAARAEGSDGSLAHTTPVYVKRPPYRFWKLDEAEALIEKREKSLDEIESLLEAYKDEAAADAFGYRRDISEFVEQGPALMERVNEARAIYEDLRAAAGRERAMRAEG